jgi:hypothetical protein
MNKNRNFIEGGHVLMLAGIVPGHVARKALGTTAVTGPRLTAGALGVVDPTGGQKYQRRMKYARGQGHIGTNFNRRGRPHWKDLK